MRTYIAIVAMFLLTGCASQSATFEKKVTPEAKFNLRSLKVAVKSHCSGGDKHFHDSELQELFTADVEKHLCQLRPCVANPALGDILVDVEVTYQRVMNGEELLNCTGGYRGAVMAYHYTLSKNGEIIHSASASDLEANRGFLKNLKRIGVQLSGTGAKDDEKDDIDHMTAGLAARIAKGR